jgi:C2 domain
MNVAFVSTAFTRSLYKGLVEVTPIQIVDLPDEEDTAEGLMSGGGTDAYLLVAAIEGQWKEDIKKLQTHTYHDGVLGLMGAAHVGKSRTAWSNVNIHKSKAIARKTGAAIPYHVPSTWGKGGQAVFPDEPPFYLYVQDPKSVRLVFTVMDADVIGGDDPIGSAHIRLSDLIPFARLSGQEVIDRIKGDILEKFKGGGMLNLEDENALMLKTEGWTGKIKLTSKPRKKSKNTQVVLGAAAGAMVAGPMGAAVGGFFGSMYEGEVRRKGGHCFCARVQVFPYLTVFCIAIRFAGRSK